MAVPTGFRLAVALVGILLVVEAVGAESDAGSIAEILKNNGLPEGLLPGIVKSYSLSENGKFQVSLKSSCTTKIDTEEVYYKKSITGELSYGKIKNLSGIQAHEFFWVSITGMEVDQANPDIIWFKVGFISKSINVDFFRVSPTCNALSEEENETMTFSAWLSKALSGTLEVKMPEILVGGNARKYLQ